MQTCLKVMRHIRRGLFLLSAVLIAIATALATVNAIARFFGEGFTWTEELCSYCIVLMAYLAIPHLEGANDQLCISAIDLWVKGKVGQTILNYIRSLVTSVVLVVMGWHGVDVMLKAFRRNQLTYVLHMPKGILYAIAMVCLVVGVLTLLVIMICNKGEADE